MLRWIWSISECNLMIRDSRKRTPMGGPFVMERRGSWPEKQQPKRNPCRPVGRNWRKPLPGGREKSGTCLQCVWQRLIRSVETWMVFQLDPWLLLGGIAHHKHWPQNMCYTHSWPQHPLIEESRYISDLYKLKSTSINVYKCLLLRGRVAELHCQPYINGDFFIFWFSLNI